MKTFLFIFIFALSLKAESSYQGKCIDYFYLTSEGTNNMINVFYSHIPTIRQGLLYSPNTLNEIVNNMDKFKYDPITNRCNAIMTVSNNTLGMTNEHFNFMMALTGLLTSILLVFIIYKKV